MSKVKRLYFADILRVLVILSLIPFHAAITYTGHGDVYVYDPAVVSHYLNRAVTPGITSVPLDLFIDLLDNFFMRLLFVVSGIAAFFSLRRRTPGLFTGERTNKLLLPPDTRSDFGRLVFAAAARAHVDSGMPAAPGLARVPEPVQ